ncbi:MAG: DUF2062 domain-containing protein [Candidatus Aureabacteria bacterium]|nr:DUF2062 domain-containing protein [Candidatus Auribacterota bacterium]
MTRKWFKRTLDQKEKWKNSFLHSLFGERLFHRDLWHVSRKSLAGGLALGLFLAFTPTVPFHMVLAAIGAILFRVNLPVAVLVCWINNPFTMYFIYLYDLKLGRFLFERVVNLSSHVTQGRWEIFMKNTSYLWLGSFILSSLAALAGYCSTRVLWRYLTVQRWKKRKFVKINNPVNP